MAVAISNTLILSAAWLSLLFKTQSLRDIQMEAEMN